MSGATVLPIAISHPQPQFVLPASLPGSGFLTTKKALEIDGKSPTGYNSDVGEVNTLQYITAKVHPGRCIHVAEFGPRGVAVATCFHWLGLSKPHNTNQQHLPRQGVQMLRGAQHNKCVFLLTSGAKNAGS